MDIGFDRNGWALAPAGRSGGDSGPPDWFGLRARLQAARAARLALAGECADRAGSFDSVSARALSDFAAPSDTVNPVLWANGKPGRIMDPSVAGESNPGDRG